MPQRAKSPYIDGCFEAMGVVGSVYINSQIPSSSGLGSSAAVTVATLSAINDEFSLHKTREDIANMAFEIEKTVQKGRASPTDTTVSTYGGIVLISGRFAQEAPPAEHAPRDRGFAGLAQHVEDGRAGGRAQEEAPGDRGPGARCNRRGEHERDPPPQQPEGTRAVHEHEPRAPRSHSGWVTRSSQRLVLAARSAGAFGAKITGAGGGGCMVALCPKQLKHRVAGAIEACDARAIVTGIDTEGVRKEKNV